MKLAISNMAWDEKNDVEVYRLMEQYGFEGLEILPTRLISVNPYDHVEEIAAWRDLIDRKYGFQIVSMQSIWYGRQENIFGSKEEREKLIAYTGKAVEFAKAMGCGHMVFGCPKNRIMPVGKKEEDVLCFFRTISDMAALQSVCIGIEANPPIYNTNFINTTQEADAFAVLVGRENFMLNFDFGTLIENGERVDMLRGKVHRISHVHISEPLLRVIRRRDEHRELFRLLHEEDYQGFVSIEMGNGLDAGQLEEVMEYVAGIAE